MSDTDAPALVLGGPAASPAPVRRSPLIALLGHTRYVLSQDPVTAGSFALFVFLLLCALLGPSLVPYDPLASDTAQALHPPTAAHWFGTDQLGRDILSRVVVASRIDMAIAVFSVALVFVLGGIAGVAAGFFGGWTDRIVGRLADTIMAFPLFVLAMGIVAALGNTVTNIVLATAIVNFPLYARVARAEALVRRNAGYVQAARLTGNGEFRVVLTTILPNILPIMAVQMSLTMGYAILNAAGLSFIGLGVRPPTPEWGIMVAEGARFIIHVRQMVAGRAVPRPRADAGRALLQPARRRAARYPRPPEAHMRRHTDEPDDPASRYAKTSARRPSRHAAARCRPGRARHIDLSLARRRNAGHRRRESGSGKSVTGFADDAVAGFAPASISERHRITFSGNET